MRQTKSLRLHAGLTRRTFLQLVTAGTGVLALSGCGWNATTSQPASAPARVLPAFPRAASTGRVRTFTFEAAPVKLSLGGKQITTWAYNGSVPGPEIRLTEGDTLRVTLKNRLPEDTSIHWHGVPLVNAMDGVPDITQPPIKPGQEFTYEFVAPVAGTYLYHSHSGLQLDRGLYGPLIIEPASATKNYEEEFVLMLDDWLDGLGGNTPEKSLKQLIANGDQMGGMQGNMGDHSMGTMGQMTEVPPDIVYPLYVINGKSGETPLELKVRQGQRIRLRLINAASSTIYRVAVHSHRMTVTHADGLPVEPVEVEALRIGMGERYDVLLTLDQPGVWQLAAQVEGTKHMGRALVRYEGSGAAVPSATFQPPELMGRMLTYQMLKAAPGVVTPPGKGEPDTIFPMTLSGGAGQYVWKINDRVFPDARHLLAGRNRWIRFQLDNTSMMPHPMHLHGHFFQVNNGTGRGPLKDTVIVDAMQKLTIDWIADNPGAWVFHCHNAYHQSTGMMQVVQVQ